MERKAYWTPIQQLMAYFKDAVHTYTFPEETQNITQDTWDVWVDITSIHWLS